MEKFKVNLSKLHQEAFSLNNEPNAVYQPNASEFYSRAFIADSNADFRVIPGIKTKDRVAKLSFGGDSILKEFNCGFNPEDLVLDAKEIEIEKITVPHQICQSELEESFNQLGMGRGQDGWKTVSEFWDHYMNTLGDKIAEDLAVAKWQSQSGTGLATIVGFEELIANSTDTVEVTFASSNYNVANIEQAFEALLTALPSNIARAKNELRFYVSPANMNKIMISMAKNNTQFYVTKELAPMYAGIKISEQGGMSDEMIALTRKNNLVIGVDAEFDSKAIKVRDLDVIAEPVIRTRVDFNYGTLILNDEEIFYTLAQ